MFFLLNQPQKQGAFSMHRVKVRQRGPRGMGVITDPYGRQKTCTCQAVTWACAPSDLIRPQESESGEESGKERLKQCENKGRASRRRTADILLHTAHWRNSVHLPVEIKHTKTQTRDEQRLRLPERERLVSCKVTSVINV